MHLRLILAGLILFGAASPALLAQQHPNLDAKAIVAQQAAIRAEAVGRNGRYKDMPAAKREELFALQDKVTRQLADRATTTELREQDQIAVFNALEGISAIINQAEDERMICERKRPVGSNRTQTVCSSVAQRRQDREDAEKQVTYRDQQCFKDSSGQCL